MTTIKVAPQAKTDINWRLHGSVTDMTQSERQEVLTTTIEEFGGLLQMKKDIKSYRKYAHQNLIELKVLREYITDHQIPYRHPVNVALREKIEKLVSMNQNYRVWTRKRTFVFDHLLPRTGTRLEVIK